MSGGGAHADGEAGGGFRNEVDEIGGAPARAPPAMVIQALDSRALLRGFRWTKSECAVRTRRPQCGAHSKGWGGLRE